MDYFDQTEPWQIQGCGCRFWRRSDKEWQQQSNNCWLILCRHRIKSSQVKDNQYILPETDQETTRWRPIRGPVHSGNQGGTECSRVPGHPGEEAGSDHSPGPSFVPALCRPQAPAALKVRPLLITYLSMYAASPFTQHIYAHSINGLKGSSLRRQ